MELMGMGMGMVGMLFETSMKWDSTYHLYASLWMDDDDDDDFGGISVGVCIHISVGR